MEVCSELYESMLRSDSIEKIMYPITFAMFFKSTALGFFKTPGVRTSTI